MKIQMLQSPWHRNSNQFPLRLLSIHQPKIVRKQQTRNQGERFWFLLVLWSNSQLEAENAPLTEFQRGWRLHRYATGRRARDGSCQDKGEERHRVERQKLQRMNIPWMGGCAMRRWLRIVRHRLHSSPKGVQSRRSHDSRPRGRDSGSRLDVSYLRRLPTQLN